jgi:hypothetical protein
MSKRSIGVQCAAYKGDNKYLSTIQERKVYKRTTGKYHLLGMKMPEVRYFNSLDEGLSLQDKTEHYD